MGATGNAAHAVGGNAWVSAWSGGALAGLQHRGAARTAYCGFRRCHVREAIGGHPLHSRANGALAFIAGDRADTQSGDGVSTGESRPALAVDPRAAMAVQSGYGGCERGDRRPGPRLDPWPDHLVHGHTSDAPSGQSVADVSLAEPNITLWAGMGAFLAQPCAVFRVRRRISGTPANGDDPNHNDRRGIPVGKGNSRRAGPGGDRLAGPLSGGSVVRGRWTSSDGGANNSRIVDPESVGRWPVQIQCDQAASDEPGDRINRRAASRASRTDSGAGS